MPWTEEPGGLQSIGSQRVWHDWSDLVHMQEVNEGSCRRMVERPWAPRLPQGQGEGVATLLGGSGVWIKVWGRRQGRGAWDYSWSPSGLVLQERDAMVFASEVWGSRGMSSDSHLAVNPMWLGGPQHSLESLLLWVLTLPHQVSSRHVNGSWVRNNFYSPSVQLARERWGLGICPALGSWAVFVLQGWCSILWKGLPGALRGKMWSLPPVHHRESPGGKWRTAFLRTTVMVLKALGRISFSIFFSRAEERK